MTISEAAQSSSPGARVVLYVIDATRLGGGVSRITHGQSGGAPVGFGGHNYAPVPVEADGFAWSGEGDRPTPTLRIGAISDSVVSLLLAHDRLRGAVVTRIRTFGQYLDGQPQADGSAHFPIDVYEVDRAVWITGRRPEAQFDLRSKTDVRGIKLPRQQAVRDYCSRRYRVWDPVAQAFDYAVTTCPYAGAASFDAEGNSAADAADVCGKKRGDCRLRFGATAALPFRGFPGMARVR